MKILILLIVLILTAGNSALGQNPEYKIHVRTGGLIVTHQGKSRPLNLNDAVDAAKITEAEILFATRRAGFLYLVVDVSGQSKTKQDDRQCGAGVEANLIWIKLDEKWKILNSRSVRYESCWSTITNDKYRKTNRSIHIEIDNFREDISLKLSYNTDEPEKGFQVTQEALKVPE